MMNVRLVYYSLATRDMSLLDVQQILDVARPNNDSLHICGMLCYEQRYFLQALEGERADVNELYLSIAEDARHDEVVIISYQEIDEPMFNEWQMGFAPASDHFYSLLSELGQNSFDPSELTAEQALKLLQRLSESPE
ncbi:MAG: blue light sensor protein [Oceanospirillaceae bacterium]|nr:blue light sensor protein [Oceanospirillaceae bacterium]MAX98395.1 blue light sensor protein [Oceanospirillaceae bacterium]MBL35620.1 blue light sensor protein [Oceanospirillaceae bacterium]MBS51217.1 blue light sensor protein [Oceanospirillaceae bacterium]